MKNVSILPPERDVLRGTREEFVREWSPIAIYLKEELLRVIIIGVRNMTE